MVEPHPLTRRQKLIAERSVQLGNISEALTDRFDHGQQVFDLEGSVLETEAKAAAFAALIERLKEKAYSFRDTVTTATTPTIVVRRTIPLSPLDNMVWLDTTSLAIYVYINDGRSKQWVEFD
jgi:hypothetical protein